MRALIGLLFLIFWIPAWGSYSLILFLAFPDEPITGLVMVALKAVALAAALGLGVWKLAERLPFSSISMLRFVSIHVVSSALYSALWVYINSALERLFAGELWESLIWVPTAFGWRWVVGLWFYTSFVGLVYSIQATERASRAEGEAARAQLQALQARLNPHFLFNVLNSVRTLIALDPPAAEGALNHLSDALRYTLRPGERHVTLRDEVEFANRYLALESMRLGARLDVEMSFSPGALDCSVPMFLLQPLLENAIRHGIEPKVLGGGIRVSAGVEVGLLKLVVQDDGLGAEHTVPGESDGLGLGGLRKRLAIEYGDPAVLETGEVPEGGFRVMVLLPV